MVAIGIPPGSGTAPRPGLGWDAGDPAEAAARGQQVGEGVMKGQMLAAPVTIIRARRAAPSPPAR